MEKPTDQLPKWKSGWGVRHTQILLLFVCVTAVYMLRLNLSLAVVAMTMSTTKNVPLSSGEKALVLSSIFWGYGLLQTILGNFGRRGNSVKVLSWCILISATLSLVTPLAAIHFGAVGIIVVRVLMGITQGGVYPNVNNIISMWVVPREKEVLQPFVYNGMSFGTLIAMGSSGFLAESFDWPSVFYSTGTVGIVVGGVLLYLGRCNPNEHEGISKEEKEFIRNSFGDKRSETMKKLPVPWKKILTSAPMLILTITHWCNSWGSWTVTTLTPLYVNGVLKFDVESDGFLSALSPLTGLVLSISFTMISMWTKDIISTGFARFMWNSISMYGSAIALIALAYTQDTVTAIALITAANGVAIASNFGAMSNHTDLSPNFAGVLYAFTNSVANFAAIFGPLISTYMIEDVSNPSEWKTVFLLAAAILVLGNTCFLFWGTTEKQEWNDGDNKQAQVE